MNNQPARTKRKIVFRPVNEEKLQQMYKWIQQEKWDKITCEQSAHKKAESLQHLLVSKYHEYFPEKIRIVSNDDQPFFSEKLLKLKRKKGKRI